LSPRGSGYNEAQARARCIGGALLHSRPGRSAARGLGADCHRGESLRRSCPE